MAEKMGREEALELLRGGEVITEFIARPASDRGTLLPDGWLVSQPQAG